MERMFSFSGERENQLTRIDEFVLSNGKSNEIETTEKFKGIRSENERREHVENVAKFYSVHFT